jgi:hypothetical protein
MRVHLYNRSLCTWMKVKPNHIVTMRGQESILLKGIDITDCIHFNEHLLRKTDEDFHICRDLAKECAHVQCQLKSRAVASKVPSDDSISNSHVAKSPSLIACPSVIELSSDEGDNTGQEHVNPASSRKCQDLSPSFSPPHAQRSRLRSPSTSPMKLLLPSYNSTCDGLDDHLNTIWPSDFFCIDIIVACDQARCLPQPLAQAFTDKFGVSFIPSTYYSSRKHWENATQTLRNEALAAGKTPEGTRSEFLLRRKSDVHGKSEMTAKGRTEIRVSCHPTNFSYLLSFVPPTLIVIFLSFSCQVPHILDFFIPYPASSLSSCPSHSRFFYSSASSLFFHHFVISPSL